MAIDAKTALAIINEYKAGGFEDEVTYDPDNKEELISYATYLFEQAQKAFDEGERDNAIQTIIFLGNSPVTDKSYPRRSSGGLSESDERETDVAERALKLGQEIREGKTMIMPAEVAIQENLPVPQHIEGDADPMPRDLTVIDDKKCRKLSGEYNAYLSRVTYLLGVELGDLKRAEHLLEAAHASVLRVVNIIDPKTEKPKLAKVIEAEILADNEVAYLSEAVSKHEATVDMLKALQSIYSGNVSLLSREWTMRQNEWEKGR
jgi:hypothetical protein